MKQFKNEKHGFGTLHGQQIEEKILCWKAKKHINKVKILQAPHVLHPESQNMGVTESNLYINGVKYLEKHPAFQITLDYIYNYNYL